jgi:hypothetical protein
MQRWSNIGLRLKLEVNGNAVVGKCLLQTKDGDLNGYVAWI